VRRLADRLAELLDYCDRVRAAIEALGREPHQATHIRPAAARSHPRIRHAASRPKPAKARSGRANRRSASPAPDRNPASLTVGDRLRSKLRRELLACLRTT
jgi:hypothetical protein